METVPVLSALRLSQQIHAERLAVEAQQEGIKPDRERQPGPIHRREGEAVASGEDVTLTSVALLSKLKDHHGPT